MLVLLLLHLEFKADPTTPTPSFAPIPVSSSNTTEINEGTPNVELTGTGFVYGPSSPLSNVIISSGSNITATSFSISDSLILNGDGRLVANSATSISLSSNIELHFTSTSSNIGFLDLGVVGEVYDILPKVFEISIDLTGIENKDLWKFEKKIVSARKLANCEEWIKKAKVSTDQASLVCKDGENSKLLSDPQSRAIVLRGESVSEEDDSDGMSWILIVVIVVIVIIFGIFVVVLVCHLKKHQSKDRDELLETPLIL
jgi:hypothetical protein